MYQSEIISTGAYLPDQEITNLDLEQRHGISADWIFQRTGIKTRRIIAENQSTSDLAYEASLVALKNASLDPQDIDLILLATITPDQIMPSTACHLQRKLGCKSVMAFDLNAACSGFLYAMSIANQYIRTGLCQNILVVGAEVLSIIVDPQDKDTSLLFSDGAGAMILSRASNPQSKFHSENLHADGQLTSIFNVPGGGSLLPPQKYKSKKDYTLHMEGQKLFIHATKTLRANCLEAIEKNNITLADIDWILPHQANLKIIQAVADSLDIPRDKLLMNIENIGNTSSATLPILMNDHVKGGKIKKGDKLLFIAFGAGFTSGNIFLTY